MPTIAQVAISNWINSNCCVGVFNGEFASLRLAARRAPKWGGFGAPISMRPSNACSEEGPDVASTRHQGRIREVPAISG